MKKKSYLINDYDLGEIRNIYEVSVIKQMKKILPDFENFDNCQLCIEDVYALSLSRIPAVYAQVGSIMLQKEMTDDDIADIVRYSVFQVTSRPRHN